MGGPPFEKAVFTGKGDTTVSHSHASRRLVTRRSMLKGAAAGAAIVAAPAIISPRALASSGEVDVYAWGEYVSEEMIATFKERTGIQINLSVFGTNNEVLSKVRAAKGEGFDLVFPSVTTLVSWFDASEEDGVDLLQPIDENRVMADQVQPAIWDKSLDLGASRRGQRFGVPFNWGTEAVAFDSTQRDLKYGDVSWSTIWQEENRDLVTVRPRSGLTAMGVMIDGTGEMMDKAHQDEETAKKVLDQALAFAVEHKPWIRTFWKDAQALTGAFLSDGCVIGQSWDGTAVNMWKETDGRIKYVAPTDGALTWLDTMCMPSGAANIDQAYELINWLTSAEGGGMHASHAGYNSAAIGAEAALDEAAQERFKFMYGPNGEAISQLYWWKPEPGWFQKLRAEYITRYETA